MTFSTPALRGFIGMVGLATALVSCEDKKPPPAALPGRWNLTSQHVTNTDATTGQVVADYHRTGTSGDYVAISASTFEEYSGGQLSFTAPYVKNGNTIIMTGITPRTDYSREIKELTSKKLVLSHKLPAIVNNQSVAIESTYSQ
ncbi:MAG TPA: hypothetical protein VF629_24190 [Hymenobacter sp.]|jgi:hypothetical protein|uniref:hypothetical protein n=1 Tax=Hymenobacter sp. TaxID=1898978 RepID=UPI002ED823A3